MTECDTCHSVYEPHTDNVTTCTVCVRYRNISVNGTRARKRSSAPGVHMTLAEFATWFARQERVCVYCGIPEEALPALGLKTTIGLPLQRLGLDRLDTTTAYEVGNIALCCYACNSVRSNVFTVAEMHVLGVTMRQLWQQRLAA